MSDLEEILAYTPRRDPFQPGLLRELPQPPKKILILRASRIGDFINAGPAIKALRNYFPQAHIDLITLPMLFVLAERMRCFNHIIDFPGYPGLAEQFFHPPAALAFLTMIQAEHYDLAIQMQGSGVYSNPFTLMCGAEWTAGFVREGDPPGRLDAALPFPPLHEAERNLALVNFLGIPTGQAQPEFPLWEEDHKEAARLLDGIQAPYIGIHTSARDSTRRWSLERFAAASAILQERHGGTILLIGEARDREQMQAALERTRVPFCNLAGRTSLPVTGAVIKRLSIFLTNDTGPAHIAYALRAPTVAIFGGGDPARNGPITNGPFRILAHPVSCRPCETGDCPINLFCLENVPVEAVVSAAEEVLRQESAA